MAAQSDHNENENRQNDADAVAEPALSQDLMNFEDSFEDLSDEGDVPSGGNKAQDSLFKLPTKRSKMREVGLLLSDPVIFVVMLLMLAAVSATAHMLFNRMAFTLTAGFAYIVLTGAIAYALIH